MSQGSWRSRTHVLPPLCRVNSCCTNAYVLSRPPGHHCLPDVPNGFCLFNNITLGVEEVFARKSAERIAVIDRDVHHGNGTEVLYHDRADVLTLSIRQERNYPPDTGDFAASGAGDGANI